MLIGEIFYHIHFLFARKSLVLSSLSNQNSFFQSKCQSSNQDWHFLLLLYSDAADPCSRRPGRRPCGKRCEIRKGSRAPHKRPESRRRHTAERRSAQLPGNSVRPFPRINRNSRCRHTNQQRQQNRPSHHRHPFRFRQPPQMRGKFLWPFTLFYEKIPRFVRRFFLKRNPVQRTRKRGRP